MDVAAVGRNVARRYAGESVPLRIEPDHFAVGIGDPRKLVHVLGQQAEALLALAQGALRAQVRPDIAGDLAGADDLAGGVAHRRDADRNVEQVPVLVQALGVERLHALSRPDALEDAVLLFLPVGRQQPADGTADHLVRCPAEQLLRRRIPGDDHAVGVLGHDRVVGGFDERGVEIAKFRHSRSRPAAGTDPRSAPMVGSALNAKRSRTVPCALSAARALKGRPWSAPDRGLR